MRGRALVGARCTRPSAGPGVRRSRHALSRGPVGSAAVLTATTRLIASVENCTNWPIMMASDPLRLPPYEMPPPSPAPPPRSPRHPHRAKRLSPDLSPTQKEDGAEALPQLRPLRFGCLGTSYITERVITQQAALDIMIPHAKVVAVAGRTLENAQRIAARAPGAWATSSYEAVVLSPRWTPCTSHCRTGSTMSG